MEELQQPVSVPLLPDEANCRHSTKSGAYETKPEIDSERDVDGGHLLHSNEKLSQNLCVGEIKLENMEFANISSTSLPYEETAGQIRIKVEQDEEENILADDSSSNNNKLMEKDIFVSGNFPHMKLENDERDAFKSAMFDPMKSEVVKNQVECNDVINTIIKSEPDDDCVYIDTYSAMEEQVKRMNSIEKPKTSFSNLANTSEHDCDSMKAQSSTATKQVVGDSLSESKRDVDGCLDLSGRDCLGQGDKPPCNVGKRTEEDIVATEQEKQFQCTICYRTFRYNGHLRRHKRVHEDKASYKCSVCGIEFVGNSHLQTHMRIHTGEKPNMCDVCGAKFIKGGDLRIHMRIHTGEKPYICSVCSGAFRSNSLLRKHIRTHTGERPYKCTECSKTWRQLSALQRHMRIHTGERPYKCSVCNAAFYDGGRLQRHFRIHSGVKPYKCTVCDTAFNQMCTLQAHMRIHTGEKPFVCTVCGAAFRQSSPLKKHMSIHLEGKPLKSPV